MPGSRSFSTAAHIIPTSFCSAEWRLLLSCSRVQALPQERALQRELAAQIDAEKLLQLADRHRIAGLLWHNLKQHESAGVDSTLMAQLARRYRDNAIDALAVARLWKSMDALFKAQQMDYLSLKGLPLAAAGYQDIALRHCGDLDIWIAESQYPAVRALMIAEDFVLDGEFDTYSPRQQAHVLNTKHELTFFSAQGLKLELHWRLSSSRKALPGLNMPLSAAQRRQCALAGADIPMLADEEQLIYLCAHGCKHLWFRLKWLFDLPQLLATRRWDWARVLQLAQERQAERMLLLSFLLLQKYCSHTMPDILAQRLQQLPDLPAALPLVEYAWQQPENWWEDGLSHPFARMLRLLGYWRRLSDAGIDWGHEWDVFATSEGDWKFLPLPDRWFFLYYPLRPFLQLGRALQRRLQ